jgi:hypothetical protein
MDNLPLPPFNKDGTDAERLIRHEVSLLQRRAAEVWIGAEKQAIIEIIGALQTRGVRDIIR